MIDENTIVEIFLVISTIAVAIVTWIKMGQSNKLLKRDLDVRIRPSLSRTVIGNISTKGINEDTINESVYSLQYNKILFHFTNSGSLPAINITQKYYVALRTENGLDQIRSSDELSKDGIKLPALAPKEKYSVDLFYNDEHHSRALVSDNCYFGLELTYEDANNSKYFYSMYGHFDHGFLMLDDVNMN